MFWMTGVGSLGRRTPISRLAFPCRLRSNEMLHTKRRKTREPIVNRTDWERETWVSLVPNGFGQVKPNHYAEIAKAIWRNRRELPFALRILTKGVCDGCALGTTG